MKCYFREDPKKVCHGQQLAEELLALERLQQRDCAQVSFYKHTLAFIWLTDVLVLQLIYAESSNGTHRGIGSSWTSTLARQYLPALRLQVKYRDLWADEAEAQGHNWAHALRPR